jgi:hypothetical protein
MATKANAKQSPRQGTNNRGGNDSYYIPPPPVSSPAPNENSQVGFLVALISMTVVFALILPIISFMYIDILEAKKETKRQQEQVQRLINQIKKEKDQ